LARLALSALALAARAGGLEWLGARADARLALLDGRFHAALDGLSTIARALDAGALGRGPEVDAARRELSVELALVHEAAARAALARGDARAAIDHLEASSVHTRSDAPIRESRAILSGALLTARSNVARAEARVVEARAELDAVSSPTHRAPASARDAARTRLADAERACTEARRQTLEIRARVAELVRGVHGEGLELPELILADVFGAAGDVEARARFLAEAVVKVPAPAERAAILHALAGARLELGDHRGALDALESAAVMRATLDASSDAAVFLDVQARLLGAELALQAAHDETRRAVAVSSLRGEVDALAGDALPPAADALRTRMQLRLATLLTAEPSMRSEGLERMSALASAQDPEIAGEARLQLGLARIAEGRAVEGIAIFRAIEAEQPGSAAACAVREMPALAHLRDADGRLPRDPSEANVEAALRVALDAAMKVPDGRTIALMVLGAGAVALTGGTALPALLAGAGLGATVDRALEIDRRASEVRDAHASALSRVDADAHATHLLMLGVEALSFGVGGRIAPLFGALARNGVTRAAAVGARFVPRLDLGGAGVLVGRALLHGTGKIAEHAALYTTVAAGRGLVTGRFAWDPREALLMSAMITSYGLAQQLGAGRAAAKALGLGADAAKLTGFTADALVASSVHFALLTGLAVTTPGAPAPARLDELVAAQLTIFAAWQAGQAAPSSALDRLVATIDGSTAAGLARAEANLPGGDGRSGLRPREAYALGRAAPRTIASTEIHDARRPWAALATSIERPARAASDATGTRAGATEAPKAGRETPEAALAEHGLDPASTHFDLRDLAAARALATQLGPEAAATFERRARARLRRDVEACIAAREGRSKAWLSNELATLHTRAEEAGFTLKESFLPTTEPVDVTSLPAHLVQKIAAIRAGESTIRVASRAEAELILHAFPELAETPSWPKSVIKEVFASEPESSYHWDAVFGPDGRLLHHRPTDEHAREPHLQLELEKRESVRIFWPKEGK
ncbi:hypothetical protein L6R52_25935, partial [Myxococcota bacterium]|nr:hypothetical protein [Myxococcota bacterium]